MGRRRTAQVVDQSLEVRITDLIRHYKSGGYGRGETIPLGPHQLGFEINLRGVEGHWIQLQLLREGKRVEMGPRLPIVLMRPPLGGWSAYFLCPKPITGIYRCGKRVRSLFRDRSSEGVEFACRHCLGLVYVSRQKRRIQEYDRIVPRREGGKRLEEALRRQRFPRFSSRPEMSWSFNPITTPEDRAHQRKVDVVMSLRAACLEQVPAPFSISPVDLLDNPLARQFLVAASTAPANPSNGG